MEGLVIGIIASIVGGLAVLIIQKLIKIVREQSSSYTGKWEIHIYDKADNIIKRDLVNVFQVGDELYGNIERVFPAHQVHRRWNMKGRLRGKDFFALFWSIDPTIQSFGCWYVHQKDDFLFEGYYLKLDEKTKLGVKPIKLAFVKNTNS